MSYLIDTVTGVIAFALIVAVPAYIAYVLLGVLERRQKRNRRVTSIPPKAGFRDCNGPVRVR